MDFTLSLSYQEQNDNKAIILTDTSNINDTDTSLTDGDSTESAVMYEIVTQAVLDFTTIGAANNNAGTRFYASAVDTLGTGDELQPVTPDATEITAATLLVKVTGTSGTQVTKGTVDLYTEFAAPPFGSQNEMVYTITADLLGDEADSLLEDGLYELTYTLTALSVVTSITVTILVYGQVKVGTYEKLRNISTLYMCQDGAVKSEISEADLCGAYLSSIENSAYVAKTEELLSMLVVLDNMILNDSNITW